MSLCYIESTKNETIGKKRTGKLHQSTCRNSRIEESTLETDKRDNGYLSYLESWLVKKSSKTFRMKDTLVLDIRIKSQQENMDANHQYAGKLICHTLLSSL